MRLRAGIVTLLLLSLTGCAHSTVQRSVEGRYEYEPDTSLVIAERPADGAVFAVINGARYPLRAARPDVFLNSSGTEVHFVRDATGRVLGYRVRDNPDLESNPLRRLLDPDVRLPLGAWHPRPPGAPDRYDYRPPSRAEDGLAVRALAPDDQLRINLTAFTQSVYDAELPAFDSLLVYRGDALVFEEYFHEYDGDTPHQLRSATKTLMALLVGAALDRGAIASLDAPVLAYFPEYDDLASLDDRKRAITIRHLLTMQSGLACNDWDQDSPGNESVMVRTDDWARFILDLPMQHAPGVEGSYCSGNVVLAGRIVEKATGQSLRTFADEVLFAPLGIVSYEWDFRPDRSNTENFVQAWLRPRDMLKIGIMIRDGGQWRRRQIIGRGYIESLTSPQSQIEGTPYGYFYWRRYLNLPSGRIETPQASGNGGQKIIVLSNYDTVVVMTGGAYNEETEVNEVLARYLVPALQAD